MVDRGEQVSAVAYALTGAIVRDATATGTPLPKVDALAAVHGVDEGVIREALRDLQALNLVTLVPDGPAVVRDWRQSAELTLLPHFFRHAPPGPEKVKVAEDILHARRVVLAEAAARAAERATPSDLESLRAIAEAMREQRGDSGSLLELDRCFLGALIDATHNPVMRWIANSFFHVYDSLLRVLPQIWSLPHDHFNYLDELVANLEAQDAEETAHVVRRHLERTDPVILALIRLRLST